MVSQPFKFWITHCCNNIQFNNDQYQVEWKTVDITIYGGVSVLRNLTFATVASAAALTLLAGTAQADKPDWASHWHKSPTYQQCEQNRRDTAHRGIRVSDNCEYDGGESYQYWT